jgi:hypothetical protein
VDFFQVIEIMGQKRNRCEEHITPGDLVGDRHLTYKNEISNLFLLCEKTIRKIKQK